MGAAGSGGIVVRVSDCHATEYAEGIAIDLVIVVFIGISIDDGHMSLIMLSSTEKAIMGLGLDITIHPAVDTIIIDVMSTRLVPV